MQSLALLLVLPDNAVWLYLSVRLCIETYYHRYVTTWLGAVITVGTDSWLPDLVERAKALTIGNGFQEGVDLGPVISPQSKAKIESLIAKGGKILLDGRHPKAPEGYPDGNWVAPTIIEVEPGDEAYDLEIFGPVLCVVKRDSLEDAIKVINANRCMFIIDLSTFWKLRWLYFFADGNGAAIFTQSGAVARKFEKTVEAGQLGAHRHSCCSTSRSDVALFIQGSMFLFLCRCRCSLGQVTRLRSWVDEVSTVTSG
jgi:acyl-CoA reductase-like NAD-dependent aldehyde dehydrogenase